MTLTARQVAAVDALMQCPTIEGAAASARVNRATLFRWLSDATFCDALRKAQSDAVAGSARRMARLMADATDVLARALSGDATETQRRAAVDVLTHGARLHELGELDRRIGALEAANAKH